MFASPHPIALTRARALRRRLVTHLDDRGTALVLVDRGETVGWCTVVAPAAARIAGGYPIEERFDIASLDVLRERMVEVGTAIIHPEYRRAGTTALLREGLARYLIDHGYDYVLASVSLALDDAGQRAASLLRLAGERWSSPVDYRVRPRQPVPVMRLRDPGAAQIPAALRAWLDMGAWSCGEPAYDGGIAELPLLLPLARMRGRLAQSFLARAA